MTPPTKTSDLGYTSDPIVRRELERLAAPAKASIVEQFIERRETQLITLQKKFAEYGIDFSTLDRYRPAYSFEQELRAKSLTEKERMRAANAVIERLLIATHNRDGRTFSIKPPPQNHFEAVKYADDVWGSFLRKMESKVCGLGITSIESTNFGSSERWTSAMHCSARNGVTFTLTNSIVTKYSNRGLRFNQFPTRFSDVCQNGKRVKHAANEASVRSLCNTTAQE